MPIRVLQVVTIMNRGGLETMLMNYYRQIDRNKIQFDFLVHREEEGHYDQEIKELGGKIFRMQQIRPGNYRSYFKQLDFFFATHPEYKVVHSHINENSSFVLRAAKKFGIPCRIAHSHLSDLGIDKKLPFRLYARFSMKDNPNQYFACSNNAGKWLFGKQVTKNKGVTVLNNAVNVSEFQFSETIRSHIRKELDVEGKLVIGHIGRFNKQKNHDFLIEIFYHLQQKNPDSVLIMVGDGDSKSGIEKKVAKLGLTSKVRFLGIRSDIPNLMQGMDLFLFPSLFEGLPVVLIEAQAAGLPCIVSDTITRETDITETINFISLQSNPDIWAEKILSTSFCHQDTSDIMRRNGYDTETMARWLTHYYIEQSNLHVAN